MSFAFQENCVGDAAEIGSTLRADPLRMPHLRRSDLPPELAFLRQFGIADASLSAAVRSADKTGIAAADALIADGGVSEPLYYFSLSQHLDRPYVWTWPDLADDADAVVALRTQRVQLGDGRWLLAPPGAAVRVLLAAKEDGDIELPDIAITSPSHFEALVRRKLAGQMAHAASDALSDAAPGLSARTAASRLTIAGWFFAGICCAMSLWLGIRPLVDGISTVFFAALVFRLLVCAAGLPFARPPAHEDIGDRRLPVYSVLVALYDEVEMVPALVARLAALDYPPAKLDVIFLVEARDAATRLALLAASLPSYMRVFVVPDGEPRTKPRALNAGLLVARGQLVTVYDAEDRPDPQQLRRAASRFADAPAELACLQARLAIANGERGLLPCLFAIEYAALFDLYNVGSLRLGLPLALGGTSNHFRRDVLRRVGGWDAYNVTEDADLGFRLARFGYLVEDLSSTTLETAEESPVRWFNQRRRWTKGWMQTALVLLRSAQAWRDFGARHSAAVGLMLVNLIAGPLISPFALVLVATRLAHGGLPQPHGAVELTEVTLWTSVLVLGLVVPLASGYAGIRARGLRVARGVPLLLAYQAMISVAAWGGLIDLVRRPHHWRKTPHTAPAASAASLVHRAQRRRRGERRSGDRREAQRA